MSNEVARRKAWERFAARGLVLDSVMDNMMECLAMLNSIAEDHPQIGHAVNAQRLACDLARQSFKEVMEVEEAAKLRVLEGDSGDVVSGSARGGGEADAWWRSLDTVHSAEAASRSKVD